MSGRAGPALVLVLVLVGCVPPPESPRPLGGGAGCAWGALAGALDSAIAAGAAPGAVVAVSHQGRRFVHGAGRLGQRLPRRPDGRTIYDLASLSKVVALTSLVMNAVDEGRLELDAAVQQQVPEFTGPGKDAVTIRHLLTHTSGLPAGRRLWREGTRREALALALATPLDTAPGTRTMYSDLGAIALGVAVERAIGRRLDLAFQEQVAKPLGLRDTRFRPAWWTLERTAPTERDPWRGRVVHGEVHDENAAWLGGVAGHAGLFGSAEDLLAFGEWMLGKGLGGKGARTQGGNGARAQGGNGARPVGGRHITPVTIREFTRRQDIVPGSSRGLGWDTPSQGSSAGTRLSADSFGHTGFTGTSIWVDPTRELVIVLLTNRVHPSRENTAHIPLRIRVADLAAALADAAPNAGR